MVSGMSMKLCEVGMHNDGSTIVQGGYLTLGTGCIATPLFSMTGSATRHGDAACSQSNYFGQWCFGPFMVDCLPFDLEINACLAISIDYYVY